MTDIRKYVEGKSQAELLQTQRTSVVDGDIYKAVTFEIQRIQQDTNNIQIANLTDEVKRLKEIADQNTASSDKNARSSTKIAIAAFCVGVLSVVIAAIQTETSYNHECTYTGTVELKNQTVYCQTRMRVGAHDFYWHDEAFRPVKYN